MANTEAFFFKAPEDALSSLADITLNTPVVNVDSIAEVTFLVPSPNSGVSSESWISLEGVEPSNFYNARFSWSALDPIEVVHFDLVQTKAEDGTRMLLKLETRYNCFTKDTEFMNSPHNVTGSIRMYSLHL